MKERPIRCGREGCGWRGYESDLQEIHGDVGSKILSCSACPTCGYDSTSNMTPGEIQVWQRAQAHKES
ncbi:hypothetical protein HMPREF9701_04965 [Delftia acidovorans CCUG 274B]|uniref:hypothetical protein n=1 Tax=Delftia acidovorans TaxID=80866 RepID=UPI0003536D50|nr:hypothetical protein [Delftia acidovorans]EPD35932.1 hypothetical protein HMPREF9701_04965 [Delftia acidovorans CCUG 274B]